MLRDLVLPVASDEIRHDLFGNPIRGPVARRIAEGSSVSAQSCVYLGAVCYRVSIRREEEVLQLLDENQNSIDQSSTTRGVVSHRLSRRTDQI
jgi:hypothetical protein